MAPSYLALSNCLCLLFVVAVSASAEHKHASRPQFRWHATIHHDEQDPSNVHVHWGVSKSYAAQREIDMEMTRHVCFARIRPTIRVSSFYVGASGTRDITRFGEPTPVCSDMVAWKTSIPLSLFLEDNLLQPLSISAATEEADVAPSVSIHSISFVLRIPAILSRESFVSFVPEEPIAMQFHAQNWDQFYIDFVASKSPLWTAVATSENRNNVTAWYSTNEFIDSSSQFFSVQEVAAVAGLPLNQQVSSASMIDSVQEANCVAYDSAWKPQLLAVADVLVVSTGIGVAMNNLSSQGEATFTGPALENWRFVLPFCTKVFHLDHINLFEELFSSALYLVPVSNFRLNNVLRTENFELLPAPTVYIFIPKGYPTYVTSIVHGNTKAFSSGGFTIYELLDNEAQSVGQALRLTFDDSIVSVASSKMRPIGSHTLLIRKASGELILAELTESQKWSIVNRIPEFIPAPKLARNYPVLNTANMVLATDDTLSEDSEKVKTDLTGAVYARAETHILLLWGSNLFVSTNSGNTLWIVQQSISCGSKQVSRVSHIPKEVEPDILFASDNIVSVTTSQGGEVAVYTKSGSIWIGDVTTGCVMPYSLSTVPALLSRKHMLNATQLVQSTLFYNEVGVLKIGWLGTSTSGRESRVYVKDVHSLFADDALMTIDNSQAGCPIQASLEIEPNSSKYFRRSNINNGDVIQVFLDHSQSYAFKFEASLKPSNGDHISPGEFYRLTKSLDVSVVLGQGTSDLNVSVLREDDIVLGKVKFVVVLTEGGAWHLPIRTAEAVQLLGRPGEFLYMVDLGFHMVLKPSVQEIPRFSDTLAGCFYRNLPFLVTGSSKVRERVTLEAYTGCPPGRVIYAVLDEEYEESQGCVTENDVPCFYFENDYKLHVLINDTILDYSEEFQIAGIRVVGGGPSFESIRSYTENETLAYTPKILNYDVESELITWLCWPGSPCSGTAPNFPRTPEFYLVLELYREGSLQISTGHPDSYCVYTSRITVRLHNIPLDIPTTFTIIAVSFSTMMSSVFLSFCLKMCTSYRKKVKIAHLESTRGYTRAWSAKGT